MSGRALAEFVASVLALTFTQRFIRVNVFERETRLTLPRVSKTYFDKKKNRPPKAWNLELEIKKEKVAEKRAARKEAKKGEPVGTGLSPKSVLIFNFKHDFYLNFGVRTCFSPHFYKIKKIEFGQAGAEGDLPRSFRSQWKFGYHEQGNKFNKMVLQNNLNEILVTKHFLLHIYT